MAIRSAGQIHIMAGPRSILLLTLLGLLILPFLLFGYLSVRIFETHLLPEVETQTVTAAAGVQRRVDHAATVFGGLHTLRGVEPVLDSARSSAPGMSFLALSDVDGTIQHISADDAEAVRMALASASESGSPGTFDGLSTKWQEFLGIPLSSPVTVASRQGGHLLVTALPIGGDDEGIIGTLYAGFDIRMLDALKQDIWIDTAVVVFATVLLAVELLVLMFAVHILRPAWIVEFFTARLAAHDLRFSIRSRSSEVVRTLTERVDRIVSRTKSELGSRSFSGLRLPATDRPQQLRIPAVSHVRLPLFLFFVSEAMLRPILPQFLGQFAPPDSDPNFRIGIAMAGFMAASLLSVLIGSMLCERSGPRRIFLLGALFAGAGMAGHIFADSFAMIVFARSLTGFGYGLVYAAAQVHIVRHADPRHRSTGFSLFLAVVVAAEISGPAVGGILADRIGVSLVLYGALVAIGTSALACLFMISRFPPDLTDPYATPDTRLPERPSEAGSYSSAVKGGVSKWVHDQMLIIKDILGNPRFFAMIACFAIPAKALLTGGLFLLVPLSALTIGGAAESARILMGYGIAILVLAPLLAPLADRWQGFGTWVAVGGMIAGAGFVLPHTWNVLVGEGLTVLFVATLLFGVGQTLSIPTQISFLMRVAELQVKYAGSGTVLGVFRFLERLGSLAGPLIAGALLLAFPPDTALMWMGIGALLLSAGGVSWFLAFGERDEEEAIRGMLVEA